MAKRVIFKLEPTSNFIPQLLKGVRREGSRVFAGRVLSRASMISADIGTMLVKVFNSTAVARALRGQGATDLPAHFGLSDSVADSLADGMGELIRSSVMILSRKEGNTFSITIRAVPRDWSKYLSLPGAQYVSSPSNMTIPVVRWLLIDPSIDIGQAAYALVFQGDDKSIDARIQKVSRSGRAIMVSLEALGGGNGYVLPAIVSGSMGKNFIEMIIGQPGVARKAAQILMNRIR